MARTLAIFNNKGGLAKTSTSVNMAASLGLMGKKVLLIDGDAQGNDSICLGVDKDSLNTSLYDLCISEVTKKSVNDAIVKTQFENLWLLPSETNLGVLPDSIIDDDDRFFRYKNVVDKVHNEFDYIIIDCPPALGTLTINALVAVQKVIILTEPAILSIDGVLNSLDFIDMINKNLNDKLSILGLLIVRIDRRDKSDREDSETIKNMFDITLNTVIRKNVAIKDSQRAGMPVVYYNKKSNGAIDYMELAKEIDDNDKW